MESLYVPRKIIRAESSRSALSSRGHRASTDAELRASDLDSLKSSAKLSLILLVILVLMFWVATPAWPSSS